MTLIAAILKEGDGHPVLIGDLLLSGMRIDRDPATLPSFRDPEKVTVHDTREVKGLRQKVVVLSGRCAIGWTGMYAAAVVVLNELASIENTVGLTEERFERYIVDNPMDVAPLGLILFLINGEQLSVCEHDCIQYRKGGITAIYQGSGSDSFVTRLMDSVEESESLPIDDPRPSALNSAFHAVGPLLGVEFFHDMYLRSGFGGGYEVVTNVSGKLEKLDHLAFVFWRGAFNRKTGYLRLAPPRAILLQDYHGPYLALRSALFNDDSKNPPLLPIIDRGFHVIGPMVGGTENPREVARAVTQVPVEPEWVCNVLMISDSEQPTGGCIVDFSTAERAADKSIKIHGDDLRMSIQPSYVDHIEEMLRAGLQL